MKVLLGGGPLHGKTVEVSHDAPYIMFNVPSNDPPDFSVNYDSKYALNVTTTKTVKYVPTHHGLMAGDCKVFVTEEDLLDTQTLNDICDNLMIYYGYTISKQDHPVHHFASGGWVDIGYTSKASSVFSSDYILPKKPYMPVPLSAPKKDEFVSGENCLF